MRIVPVIDILDGLVVHGFAGVRDRYRPIRSRITRSVLPLGVAEDLLRVYPFDDIYVADLDAIQGKKSNLSTAVALQDLGFEVYLDPGIRVARDVADAMQSIDHLVVGTETLHSLSELGAISDAHPSVVASLDFKSSNLLTQDVSLAKVEIGELVDRICKAGASEIIYLDLTRVGTRGGVGSAVERICETSPVPVLVGGGIRGPSDVVELSKVGASGVLVATCIHSGEMTGEDVGRLTSS